MKLVEVDNGDPTVDNVVLKNDEERIMYVLGYKHEDTSLVIGDSISVDGGQFQSFTEMQL